MAHESIPITLRIPIKVLEALRVEAEEKGDGYQTLIKQILSRHVENKDERRERFVDSVMPQLAQLKNEVEELQRHTERVATGRQPENTFSSNTWAQSIAAAEVHISNLRKLLRES